MDYRDRILQLVKYRPQLPSAVAKGLGVNSIIAGAMLSEMVSKRILRISNLKIGSSPLYYLPANEPLLEEFKDNLDNKSLQAFELIKEHRVLRESDQTPLIRVCLKQIRDFAKPLEVQYDGQSEVFYKWFRLSDAQAKELISKILNPDDKLVVEKHESPIDQALREKVEEASQAEGKVDTKVNEKDKVGGKDDDNVTTNDSITSPTSAKASEDAGSSSKAKSDRSDRSDKVKTDKSAQKTDVVKSDDEKQSSSVSDKSKSSTPEKSTSSTSANVSSRETSDEQQWLTAKHLSDDPLVDDVAKFCKSHKIGILWHDVKRKGAEAHFEITVPSPVGRLTFFALAKSKKRVNDTDLSAAYVTGQLRKLPTVFLSKGDLSKKGSDLLKDLKGLTFTKL